MAHCVIGCGRTRSRPRGVRPLLPCRRGRRREPLLGQGRQGPLGACGGKWAGSVPRPWSPPWARAVVAGGIHAMRAERYTYAGGRLQRDTSVALTHSSRWMQMAMNGGTYDVLDWLGR